jgi:hypothetical protein
MQNYLRLSRNNTMLTCGCGSVAVKWSVWRSMSEWRQDQITDMARLCGTCRSAVGRKASGAVTSQPTAYS